MTKPNPAAIITRVIGAAADIERNEYPAATGPYFSLSDLANSTGTAGRIEIAAACYLHGNEALRGSRAFDNCFENGDGKAVAAELARRAETDARLMAAICADFGGTFPATWRAAAAPIQADLFAAA